MKKKELKEKINELEQKLWDISYKDAKASVELERVDLFTDNKIYAVKYIDEVNKCFTKHRIFCSKYDLIRIELEDREKIVLFKYNTEDRKLLSLDIFIIDKQSGQSIILNDDDFETLIGKINKIKENNGLKKYEI